MAHFDPFLDDPAFAPHVAHWSAVCRAADGDFFLRYPWLSIPAPSGGLQTAAVALPTGTSALVHERTGGDGLGVAAVVLSALSLVLGRHARAETVIIDTPPLAGDGDGVTDIALPTVLHVDAHSSLGTHLAAAAEQLSTTYTYQDFPVAAFAEAKLGRARPASNVLLTVDGVHAMIDTSAYDLHVAVRAEATLSITMTGRAATCPPPFVALLAAHLGQALMAHRDLAQPVAQVDIATDTERARLAAELRVEQTTYDQRGTIPSLFSACASRHRDAVAIRLGHDALTYAEVEERANRLAHGLIALYGIQPGDTVGVAVSRSPLTIVAMLAVLKTGAIYVPLDPDYPEERLAFMTSDAGIKALLMQSEHIEQLMSLYEIPMFAVDLQLDTLEPADGPPSVDLSPEAPAYIIYTSGSTGTPKAVVLAHGGFVNMIAYHTEALGLGADDVLLQFYQLSFDSSLFECFMALLNGATLLLVDRETIGDPQAMSAYIATHGATMLTMPPVYLSTLAVDQLATVRRIISAGDVCRVQDAVAFAQRCAYYNSYGPTETTVCSTLYRVDPAGQYGSRIPIGRAIGNTVILLLDEQLQPVADGVPGELCVAGVSLALGYLHQDALTAAQFPSYAGVPGDRIYRTGDIAVRRPDGVLELLGRRDNQVKIRGYRIELGEIEAVLSQVDGVREVAVLAQDDTAVRRLVAYVTGAVDADHLRDAVARRLPDFMVPSAFHLLEQMPTTANGKIDRKTLPSLVVTAAAGLDGGDAAETPDQALLVELWTEVLGRPVGIRDHFFAVGGDSILVIQLVSRARALGLRLTPTQVFEFPTIETLAAVAVRTEGAADEAGPAEGAAPLGPMQRWFLAQETDAPEHFNQTALLEVPNGLALDALQSAVATVVGHHDALRLTFTRSLDGWQSSYASADTMPSIAVVDLSTEASSARLDAVRRDGEARQRSFTLDHPPLLQVVVYTTGTNATTWLLLIAHHLVVDGISWRILLDDLQRAYIAATAGRLLELPPRTTSYRGWIGRLQEASQMFVDELPYWIEQASVPLSLPRDLVPNATPRMGSSASVRATLHADTTNVLLRSAPQAMGVEVQDILLTALATSMVGFTGQNDLPITMESHGRPDLFDDVDTSRTVGWCTSQFPLRLTVPVNAPRLDTLRHIKELVRRVPNLGVGFGVLSSLADDAIGAGLTVPAPPVLFNYLGQIGGMVVGDSSWLPVVDGVPADVSPTQVRSHQLEINALVADGVLSVTWSYSTEEFLPATIERLAAAFIAEVGALVTESAAASGPQFTPSDFPAARIDQNALAVLLGQLGA